MRIEFTRGSDGRGLITEVDPAQVEIWKGCRFVQFRVGGGATLTAFPDGCGVIYARAAYLYCGVLITEGASL